MEDKNPTVSLTGNTITITFTYCGVCNSKKNKFIKRQDAKALLSSRFKTPLSNIPIIASFLFWLPYYIMVCAIILTNKSHERYNE